MQLTNKPRNLIALLFTVPVTSIGAIMSLIIVPGIVGQIILVMCQIWLLILPIIWLLKIENKPLQISQPSQSDWITGLIMLIYFLFDYF